jgi:O-antigen ligase
MSPSQKHNPGGDNIYHLSELQILSICGIFFFAPMSVAGMNISGALFLLLSLTKIILTKKLKNKPNSTVIITIIFAAWIFLSALWSPSLQDAAPTLKSLWWYALLPIGILTINWRENYFKLIVLAFISGNILNAFFFIVQISSIISAFHYDAKFGLVGYGNRVYLAMLAPPAVIILISDIKEKYFISNPFTSAMLAAVIVFELMWSTGRSAQLILAILVLMYYIKTITKSKALLLSTVVAALIAIFLTPHFIDRWNSAFYDVRLYISGDAQTNLGLRIAFWDAAIQTFLAHPLLGAGAGGYTPSFHTLMLLHKIPTIGPEWFWAIEPHNSYLAILAEYGGIGFLIYLFLIYNYYITAKNERNRQLEKFKILILLTFLLASFSDSFIWRWQGMMILLSTFSIISHLPVKKC